MARLGSILLFTLVRLAFFVVPLAVLLLILPSGQTFRFIAAILAALIGVSLSLLFLDRLRTPVAGALRDSRAPREDGVTDDSDNDYENALLDAVEGQIPEKAKAKPDPTSTP